MSVEVRCLPAVPSQGQHNQHFRYFSGQWCDGITVLYGRTAQFSDAHRLDLQQLIFQDDTLPGVMGDPKLVSLVCPSRLQQRDFPAAVWTTTLIPMFHLQFNSLDSQDAPILGL